MRRDRAGMRPHFLEEHRERAFGGFDFGKPPAEAQERHAAALEAPGLDVIVPLTIGRPIRLIAHPVLPPRSSAKNAGGVAEPPRPFTILERLNERAGRDRDRKFNPLVLGEISRRW